MALLDIRQAVADALTVITTPGGSQIQTSPYILENPSLPTAWSYPQNTSFHKASQNGLSIMRLIVQAFVGTTVSQAGQQLLDEMIDETGANSVKAALEADLTLGGTVNTLIVLSCTGYKQYPISAGVHRLGADWEVDLYI